MNLEKIQADIDSVVSHTLLLKENLLNHIYTASVMINETLHSGGKVYLFGNGQNLLVATLFKEAMHEKSKKCFVLDDVKIYSKIASSHGEDRAFDLQLKDEIDKNDTLIGISTSGNSKNVLRALAFGQALGCRTLGLSGFDGGAMTQFCNLNIIVSLENKKQISLMHLIIINLLSYHCYTDEQKDSLIHSKQL